MIAVYLIILLLGLYLVFWPRRNSSGKKLPGPRGLPFVGNAFSIKPDETAIRLGELTKQYGDIFTIKMFNQKVVCANSIDSIRTLITADSYKRKTNDRNKFFYGEEFLFGSQGIIFYREGFSAVHNSMRKAFTKGIHLYGEGIQQFEDRVLSELNNFNTTIERANGGDLDLVAMFQRSLSNIMSITLSGDVLSENDPGIADFRDFADGFDFFVDPTVNFIMSAMPFLRYIPSVYKQKYDRTCSAKNNLTERYFTQMQKTFVPGKPRGMVDVVLEEQLREKQSGQAVTLTDERIIAMVFDTIPAGVLTTLSVLSSTMLCLLNHPEYQDKVYKLLSEVIGDKRDATLNDKQSCPLIEAIELEVHRLITVVPLLQRDLNDDIQFNGFHLPNNAMLLSNLSHVHHDEKIWGDPWKFRPERFLDENGQLIPRDHVLRQSMIPFGLGRRSCIGEPFARSRYFLYITSLLQKWKFTPTPGHCWPCDPRQTENFSIYITQRPKNFLCTAEKR